MHAGQISVLFIPACSNVIQTAKDNLTWSRWLLSDKCKMTNAWLSSDLRADWFKNWINNMMLSQNFDADFIGQILHYEGLICLQEKHIW